MALTDKKKTTVNVLFQSSQEQSSENKCIQNWNFRRISALTGDINNVAFRWHYA